MSTTTESEDICVLCCREILIFATGKCDHCVCHECSTRMRVLCDQRECPICRSDMPVVLFTSFKQVFTTLGKNSPYVEKRYKIVFENEHIEKEYYRLLENKCRICRNTFRMFQQLKDHVRREHELYYCDLCVDNLKIFPFERKCYNRRELAYHKRIGDPDNTSHRGHPLCEFCDVRYVDTDELYRHLRREHFFCHFCDADGKNHYYKDHNFLKTHFRKEHFLCEEGDCVNETFTGAFRTSIDLQAHKALHHIKNKSKAEVKQARTLELEFTIAPRSSQNGNGYNSQYGDSRYSRYGRHNQHGKRNIDDSSTREVSSSIDISSQPNSQSSQSASRQTFNMQSEQEFPHLSLDCVSSTENSAESAKQHENQSSSVAVHSYGRLAGSRPGVMRNEDFPALPGAGVSVNSLQSISGSRYVNAASSRDSPDLARKAFHISVDASKMKQPVNKTVLLEASGSPVSAISIQCSSKNSSNGSNFKTKKTNLRPFQVEGPDVSNSKTKDNPTWIPAKKVTSFEEDFPALHPKSRNIVHVEPKPFLEPKSLKSSIDVKTIVPPKDNSVGFNHQITIKCKSKKKKQKKSIENESKSFSKDPDPKLKKEPIEMSALFNGSSGSTESENQENEDPTFCNSLGAKNSSSLSSDKGKFAVDELKSKQPVNLEDFPPLPVAVPKQKVPPGFSNSSAPLPPPGFAAKNAAVRPASPINISLSSVARQLTSGEDVCLRTIPKSSEMFKNNVLFHMYKQPEDFQKRNTELTKLVHQLVGENTSLFSDFKSWSGQFRQDHISADEYHKKCLDILGKDGFLEIINELVALLPEISKQKELLAVHRTYMESELKTHGAVPKWNHTNPTVQLMVCAICQQVLVKNDYEIHQSTHESEHWSFKT